MRGKNISNIGSIIRKLMSNPKFSDKFEDLDALNVWKEIVGKQLQGYIIDSRIHKGVLYVKLNSSALRNELSYQKTDLINKINKRLKKDFIKDIILR